MYCLYYIAELSSLKSSLTSEEAAKQLAEAEQDVCSGECVLCVRVCEAA